MRKHLAIFDKQTVERIFSGEKTIETRFSQKKISPFGQVNIGDLVYMKVSGKDIVGVFEVLKVISFEGLDKKDWEIIKTFWDKISLGDNKKDEEFIKQHQDAKFGMLIYIGKLEQLITSPVNYDKKDRRGWVVMDSY